MSSVFTAIRVLELTLALAEPYAATLLGEFGADVIKVERPRAGAAFCDPRRLKVTS